MRRIIVAASWVTVVACGTPSVEPAPPPEATEAVEAVVAPTNDPSLAAPSPRRAAPTTSEAALTPGPYRSVDRDLTTPDPVTTPKSTKPAISPTDAAPVAIGDVAAEEGHPSSEPTSSPPSTATPAETETPVPAPNPSKSPVPDPPPAAASTPTYHLSTTGNDAGSGSAGDPWRTWTAALSRLRPGDTLLVEAGTFTERVQKASFAPATANQPIVVRAAPGAVLKGLLWVRGADHWVFDGIRVTWDPATGAADEHMVKFTDGRGWQVTNAEIWGARSYAAVLVADGDAAGPSNWRIASSCIHDTAATNGTNQDHLIYVNAGLGNTGGRIERNVMFGARNGNGIKLGGPSSTSGGTAGVTVTRNTIHDAAAGVLIAWGSRDNVISRNLIGGMPPTKGALRAFEITGPNNRFVENAVFAADQLVFADAGFTPVDVTGNLYPMDPGFRSTGRCDGYQTTSAAAGAYGRYS